MSKLIAYLSLLVFLMAIVPLLHTGIPTGHDILTHLIYLRKFQDAFFSGQFPVRFNDWFVAGLNQPLSNFYQPAFYYIFLIPRIIGIPNTEALKIVILGLWILSGILMYLFSKRHFGTLGGILGAAFYMFAPYHIEDFVVRAAFSEFTALAFVPGIFWAIKAFYDASFPVVILGSRVRRGDSRISMVERDSGQARMTVSTKKGLYLSLLSIFIALVVLSHPPTLIMYVPILVGYVGYLTYLAQSAKRKAQSDRSHPEQSEGSHGILRLRLRMTNKLSTFNFGLLISLLFSLGLLAFFVLPALFEQKYIQIIFMRSGYYDFHNHFVCLSQLFVPNWGYGLSTNGCSDGMSFQIGLPHLLVVGMVIYFLVDKLLLRTPFKKHVISNPEGMRDPQGISRFALVKQASSFTSFSPLARNDKGEGRNDNGLLLLFLSFLAFYVFMTLEISLPFWENLPLVPFIQYSWRFLAVIMFATAFLAAGLPQIFKKETHRFAIFSLLIILLPIFYAWYLHPLRYFGKSEVDFDSPKFLSGVKPETGNLLPETGYMPKWTEVLPPIEEIPESEAKILKGDADINVVKLAAHRKEYSITSDCHPEASAERSHGILRFAQNDKVRAQNDSRRIQNDTKCLSVVRFYTHYFPGWKVRVDKELLPLCHPERAKRVEGSRDSSASPQNDNRDGQNDNCVSYDNIYGYMDVSLPKGKHDVRLSFENTPVRTAGNWISLLSAVAVATLAAVRLPKLHKLPRLLKPPRK